MQTLLIARNPEKFNLFWAVNDRIITHVICDAEENDSVFCDVMKQITETKNEIQDELSPYDLPSVAVR